MPGESPAPKGSQTPTLQEEVIYRTKEQLVLIDQEEVRDTASRFTLGVACAPFRKFGLYLKVWGKNEPDTLHFQVQFLNRWDGVWYNYKQGLFAALFFEDTDTDPAIYECFQGEVLGRAMRVKITANNASAAHFWQYSVAVDFWN